MLPMIRVEQHGESFRVVHEDGTILFETDSQTEAYSRASVLADIAGRRRSATGQDILALFPANAPAALIFSVEAAVIGTPEMTWTHDQDTDTYAIRNVEVFRSGTVLKQINGEWRKLTFTAADVLQIVEAFDALRWQPPIKVGHNDAQPGLDGLPAIGRVVALRASQVEGATALFADFERVPRAIFDAIRSGALYQRSVEFFLNIPHPDSDKRFARVLKAVSLLGEDLPAVRGMKPLDMMRPAFAADSESETLSTTNPETEIPEVSDKNTPAPVTVEQFAALQAEFTTLKASLEEKNAELARAKSAIAQIEAKSKAESAAYFCARMRKDGKLTPAEEPMAREILRALPDDGAVKFSADAEPRSVADAFKAFIEAREPHANAPGDAATRGDQGEPKAREFSTLDPEAQSDAIVEVGDKYVASGMHGGDLSKCYAQAKKDLLAGTVKEV